MKEKKMKMGRIKRLRLKQPIVPLPYLKKTANSLRILSLNQLRIFFPLHPQTLAILNGFVSQGHHNI